MSEDIQNNNHQVENKDTNNNTNNNSTTKKQTYEVNTNELTFPVEGMRNANIVKGSSTTNTSGYASAREDSINSPSTNSQTVKKTRVSNVIKDEPYPIEQLEFLHLPKDPVYQPIPLELVKANEFKEDEITYSTRIIMNLAISDYAVFRVIDPDTGDIIDNIKLPFKRVPMNILQGYIDRQSETDNIVRTVNMIAMLQNPKREDIQRLNELQDEMTNSVRERVKYGFKAFFKVPVDVMKIYDNLDYNDINFNVDAGFFRLTKSPFLRRLL